VLNPYAQIIVDEACRRGVAVEVIDIDRNFFKLKFAGRSINCMESLTDLTNAIAFRRCSDKSLTSRLVSDAGVPVPAELVNPSDDQAKRFLDEYGQTVVKPVEGEQGHNVYVGIRDKSNLEKALTVIRSAGETLILQQFVQGLDLRVIVIGGRFVAAAVRRPPFIVGDGKKNIKQLIERLDRRRQAATDGESRV
jgi:D-alanine-D-alanine ligase-like ATP-grasp enzyme